MQKKPYHKSRSRRHTSPHDLQRGDMINITTDTMSEDFIVVERNEIYAILENPNKQKLFKLSIQTGKLVDISPAFPIDVQKEVV